MKHWFALLVKPRHEKAVSAALRSKHYEEFLPLRSVRRKWSDRFKVVEMPLLAGYAFCRFEQREKVHILQTPGVRKVVGWGVTPVPVEDVEMQALQAVMRAGLPAAPCPFLRTGQSIRLDSGPLSGLSGLLLQSRGRSRLVVSVTLLQRSVAVEVEQAWISPANRSQAMAAGSANRNAMAKTLR
jgi:transcriptional antiterminator RfaH